MLNPKQKKLLGEEDGEGYLSDPAEENVDINLFSCPEEGCIKSYQKHSSLLHHLAVGKHVLRPERITLRDAAINSYAEQLENIRPTPGLTEIQDAMENFFNSTVTHQ